MQNLPELLTLGFCGFIPDYIYQLKNQLAKLLNENAGEDQALPFLIILILKQKCISDRTEDGGYNPNAPCISHLSTVLQKRSRRRKSELKTESDGQFAI